MSSSLISVDPGTRSNSPSPITAAQWVGRWLERFGARQRRILAVRGTLLSTLCLLGCMSIVMLLDSIGILSDQVRWILIFVQYTIAIGVGWTTGWQRAVQRPQPIAMAAHVEFACPELRESLLACVELTSDTRDPTPHSSQFLKALQRQVALSLEDISTRSILPWSRVRRPSVVTAGCIATLAGLSFVPVLDLPQRMGRALLPFLELERPSRTKIEVLAPAKSPTIVPEYQGYEFKIRLGGVSADQAWLEWAIDDPSASGQANDLQRTEMLQIETSPPAFACTTTIGDQIIRYRFRAGDARTSFRRLVPTSRPRVEQFIHRITFPAHAQLADSEVVSDDGSLTVLEGSTVSLGIVPSIPLTSAVAIVENLNSGEVVSTPMTYEAELRRWSMDWPVSADARYRLQLTAEVSGADAPIENTYSPFHEINSVQDHPPQVDWIADETTFWDVPPHPNRTWIVAPDEVISMAVEVADDLPAATITQQISINRGPWTAASIALPLDAPIALRVEDSNDRIRWQALDGVAAPTRDSSHWKWDMLTTGGTTGDSIVVRVSATDSLGQITHSSPIEFSLASLGFDRSRHDALLLRAELIPLLQALADLIRDARKDLVPRMQRLKDSQVNDEELKQLQKDLLALHQAWTAQSTAARELAGTIAPQLPRVIDQSEVELTVRVLSRLEKEHAARILAVTRYIASIQQRDSKEILPIERGLEEKLRNERNRQIDAALTSFDEAEGSAVRLMEITRQMIGHETLTALTKDLTYLWNHQREQLDRSSKLDFAMLARSQRVSIQYLDSIAQLGNRMQSFVSQHLRDQFQNFYRFLDQSRNELQDLIDAEPGPGAYQQLLTRVERSVEDLRHHHWAFNMDGGLWWNLSDLRHELTQRGHGIGNSMFRSIDNVSQSQASEAEFAGDSRAVQEWKNLLLDELTIALLPASDSILDRREFHLHRSPTDPRFASDMGLTMRAWRAHLETWSSTPYNSEAWNTTRDELRAITNAYRVLEAAHEMNDMRMILESLGRNEQYESQSLEGRLSHLRQWESLSRRIETTHQWMKEAGFPNAVADRFHALRWNDTSNRIRSKLEPRRNADTKELVSAATDIESLLLQWAEIDLAAAPTIEAARQLLARFAPTIQRLAERAASETRALERISDSLQSPDSETKTLSEQQSSVDRSVQQLSDALLEIANRQDILDRQQLMLAKDSDRALQWVDRVSQDVQRSTQELQQTQRNAGEPSEVAAAIEKATAQQQIAELAYDRIAEHFGAIEQSSADPASSDPQSISESRANLERESQPSADDLQSPEQQTADQSSDIENPLASYRQADELNKMAEMTPEEMLRRLEQELRRETAMQRELSQLSQENASDAVSQLRSAARQETDLTKQLENAGTARMQSKQQQVMHLKDLADTTERFAVSLLEKSAQGVQRLNLPETRKAIDLVARELQSAARSARQAEPETAQTQLDAKTQELLEAVDQAQQQLSEIEPKVSGRIEQSSSNDEKQRQGQLTEMQSWQSLMRDDLLRRAKDLSRDRQQQSDRLRQQAEERALEGDRKREERNQVLDAIKRSPENQSLQSQLDRKTKEVLSLTQRADAAKQLAEEATKMSQDASQRVQAIENAARANLDRPNPLATLATEQIETARSQLSQIQSGLKPWAVDPENQPATAPSADGLAQARAKQSELDQSVRDTAEQLARSARHEERLQNATGSEQLSDQAKRVQQASENEIATAQRELGAAAQTASQAEKSQLENARSNSAPTPSNPPAADQALKATQAASEKLDSLAQSLEQVVAPMSNAPAAMPAAGSAAALPAAGSASASTSPSSPQTPQQKARMLDSLDQQLRSGQGGRNAEETPGAETKGSDQGSQSPSKTSSSGPPKAGESQRDGAESPGKSNIQDALRASADDIASRLQSERMANRKGSKSSKRSERPVGAQTDGLPNDQGRTQSPSVGDSRLAPVRREGNNDWGRLREQGAEDISEGRREMLDPDFNEAIQAYFRALGRQPGGR